MSRGRVSDPARKIEKVRLTAAVSRGEIRAETLIEDAMSDALRRVLEVHVDAVFAEHRLKYVWDDTDTDPPKVIQVFVCKCDEGFMERRKFNEHLKRMLKEVA